MLLKGQRLTSPTDDASCGLWRFLPIARLLIPSPSATATYTEISNSTSPSPALQHSKTGVALLLLLFLCRSSVTMAYFWLILCISTPVPGKSASLVFSQSLPLLKWKATSPVSPIFVWIFLCSPSSDLASVNRSISPIFIRTAESSLLRESKGEPLGCLTLASI